MKTLKKIMILFVSLITVVVMVSCSRPADSQDSQGHAIRLSDYRGKWVVINYWATWCKPCLKEMPALNALYLGNRDDVVVLGISYDKLPNKEINAFAKKLNIRYPLLSTFPLEKLGINHLDVLPITFIINRDGKLIQTLKGPQTEQQLRKIVGLT